MSKPFKKPLTFCVLRRSADNNGEPAAASSDPASAPAATAATASAAASSGTAADAARSSCWTSRRCNFTNRRNPNSICCLFSCRLCTLFLIVFNRILFSGIQIVQQIITPTGEIHQIPIQLNAQQLQVVNIPVDDHTFPLSSLSRWSEPRWWGEQAPHSQLSSRLPQFRLKLLSLLRWRVATKFSLKKLWIPYSLDVILNLFFQTGQTIQLQGGQQVCYHKINISFVTIFLVYIQGNDEQSSLPNLSGVHPAAGLTPLFDIPFFHRHIQCTNIKNNKWKIKEATKTRVACAY